MNQYAQLIRKLKTPAVMEKLNHLYGSGDGMLVSQTGRYTRLLKKHEELVGADGDVLLISAPGRTEIGGNHTDHNRGKVLTAAINLDALAAVSKREDGTVRIFSDGYDPLEMSLSDLSVRPEEKGTTAALVRGVAARMQALGHPIGGFDAAVNSTDAPGCGMSSSAAFEVMLCAIFDALYGGWTLEAKERAQIAQYAENEYFGKPCGLLDQIASSMGGLSAIDFRDANPRVTPIQYDFAAKGVSLVVVMTGGSHADLTDDYAAIPAEMKQVAGFFGEKVLRRVRPEQFFTGIAQLRGQVSDRAILRASHYFRENERVAAEVEALQKDDLPLFFEQVIESGRSSFEYLQNVYPAPEQQQLSLALMMADGMLHGKGAWRVHGGGFAGTTLNFVPDKELKTFISQMEGVFGPHSCMTLSIRPEGPCRMDLLED